MNLFRSHYFSLVTAMSLFGAANINADDKVLTGWYDFSSAHRAHRALNSAKAAVSDIDNVSGVLYGGDGARNTWGSNDGTYGPTESTDSTAIDGAMSIRVDAPNLRFRVTNGTKRNIHLNKVVFDFASINGNSPRNLSIYYESGDLSDANETLLSRRESILNGLSFISDYEDVELDLSMLEDQILGPGQDATFRFQVDEASNSTQALVVDNVAVLGDYADFSIITYNIHGGEGPNGEGDPDSNLTAFREDFMNDEDVLCLQEVNNGECWTAVQSVFADYPHQYRTINQTTGFIWPWQSQQQTSNLILSKYPFETTHDQLIQIDPGGDRWQRHAQYVTIKLGENIVHIFHFHNTFNFNNNDFQSEKEGMIKFRDNYVFDQLGITELAEADRLIMLGDFNLLHEDVSEIIVTTDRRFSGRDHINSMMQHSLDGQYTTVASRLSDHPAIWANMDIQAPSPDPMSWKSAPATYGAGAVRMEVAAVSDPNEVEYYFTNNTEPSGSHDSGWQDSPVYIDTGLSDGVTYSYTVVARDKSSNLNTTTELTGSVTVTTNAIVPPYEESFEGGPIDWAQSTDDDYDWQVHSGGTETGAAGPSGASHGEKYLYAEGHHGQGRFKMASVEALFDFSGMNVPVLRFDYHMYGSFIDYLALDVHDGTSWTNDVWVRDGQQHANSDVPWSEAEVNLSAYAGNSNVRLRFRTAHLFWYAADPAIDNIRLKESLAFLFEPWQLAILDDAPTGSDLELDGDVDRDGMSNETEWILDTDPLTSDSAISDLQANETEMTFRYSRRKVDGVNVYAEWSENVTGSEWSTVGLTETITSDDGEIESVSVSTPMDRDRKFIRIKIQRN